MVDTGGYDAFISYRRKDGLRLANWLRSQLQGFRLPKGLHADGSGSVVDSSEQLRIFLDVAYQKASSNFFDDWIRPNLSRARHLIVVVTPSLKDTLPDGKRHWVDLELEALLSMGGSVDDVILVLGPGASPDDLPDQLLSISPNWDWIDLRQFARLGRYSAWSAIQLAKIVAKIKNVADQDIPILTGEAARTRRRALLVGGALLASVIVGLSALTAWAAIERNRAERNEQSARAAERVANEQREEAARERDGAYRGFSQTSLALLSKKQTWRRR